MPCFHLQVFDKLSPIYFACISLELQFLVEGVFVPEIYN